MDKLKECLTAMKCCRSYQGCFNPSLRGKECDKCLNLLLEEHDEKIRQKVLADVAANELKEQRDLFAKLHNELIERLGIDADKYERQDSFSAIIDVEKGKPMKEALIEAFEAVYDVKISDMVYNSCYASCVGFKSQKK